MRRTGKHSDRLQVACAQVKGPQVSIVVRSELNCGQYRYGYFLSGAKLATLVSVLSSSGIA
jgi:hypothetical protein